MNAITLDNKFEKNGDVALTEAFADINPHNLYLYVKSYQAAIRANTASVKNRSEVSGGGKKPFAQKGGGRARAGSTRSPVWVGGGQVFGPSSNRNYIQKVNKKQKKLALYFALGEHAKNGTLFVVDSVSVESGKTKDAKATLAKLAQRDTLLVADMVDEKSYLAYRNLSNCYLIERHEFNAFLAGTYRSIVIEKAVFDKIVEEA